MRFTFVVNNYPPRVGGVENHVGSLTRHLAGLGHEVVVHTLSDEEQGASTEHGVTVHRWREWFTVGGLLGFPTPAAARGIWRGVRRDDGVVSIHTRFFPLSWLGAAAGRRAGRPVLHTEHGSGFVAANHPVIRWGSRLVDVTMGRWTLRSADAVVGVSDEVVAFVRRLAGVQATVFHNAIEMPDVATGAAGRRHLVFVGRLVPGKGWEDFLAVVAAVPSEVTAEVLGDGPDMAALRARISSLGIEGRVEVRGRVPLAQVYAALTGAVLVNPTRLSEGFQTTLLEALAVGARIVTHAVPGAVLLKEQGAPVRVADRTVSALTEAVRQELDDPGRDWPPASVVSWAWPARAQEYVEVVAALVARTGVNRGRNGAGPRTMPSAGPAGM